MFDNRETAQHHKVRTGETLASLAQQNKLKWEQLAEFNFGTRDPNEVNHALADEVGCKNRDAAGNYIFDDADDPGIILIPRPFKKEGLAVRQVHTLQVSRKSREPTFLDCFGLPGATFRFGRSFIRPNTISWIAGILDRAEQHPGSRLCVFGHTDSADDVRDNKRLSERRAWALWAVLVHDTAAWGVLRDHAAEKWDEREFRRIYEAIGEPGRSGKAGSADFDRYFQVLRQNRPPIARSQFLVSGAVQGFMGCGEYNHLVRNAVPTSDPENQAKNEKNRRVVVFFFDGERPPKLPCQYDNVGPCTQNGAKEDADRATGGKAFSCAVYDRIGRVCDCELGGILDSEASYDLRYRVHDPRGTPIREHDYTLKLPDGSERQGKTDKQGLVLEFDVPAGEFQLTLKGYSHIDEDLTDTSAASEPGSDDGDEPTGTECGI